MKCVSESELAIVEETLECYDLNDDEVKIALALVEARAQDTSLPFKAYSAAHTAGATVVRERK